MASRCFSAKTSKTANKHAACIPTDHLSVFYLFADRRVKLSPTSLALYCIAFHSLRKLVCSYSVVSIVVLVIVLNHVQAWSTLGELLNIPTHFYEHIIEFIPYIIFIGLSLELFHLTLNEQVRQLLFLFIFYNSNTGS